jgi:hypothetical protein
MEEENLFPEDIDEEEESEDTAVDDDEEDGAVGYKPAPLFDYDTGDFTINGNGQILTADETTAMTQWCQNILMTDRYNHEAYSDDIGIDYSEVFGAENRQEAETILETEICEALPCDPYGRVQYVQNVEFEWIDADSLNVTVTIVGMDNTEVTFTTQITK